MKNYPEYLDHLQSLMAQLGKEIPDTMSGFHSLHVAASKEGAISEKTKELIALAIAITVRCDGCIAYHVHDAMKAGANRFEVVEAIGMAILMGGGPALMYGAEALEALEQFEEIAQSAPLELSIDQIGMEN
jgi:AhpD family alkylhydroperoxidase